MPKTKRKRPKAKKETLQRISLLNQEKFCSSWMLLLRVKKVDQLFERHVFFLWAPPEASEDVRSVDLEAFGILKQLHKHKVDKYPFAL